MAMAALWLVGGSSGRGRWMRERGGEGRIFSSDWVVSPDAVSSLFLSFSLSLLS